MKIDYYQLVKKINQAFESGGVEFLAAHLSEDIRWNITGSQPIIGTYDFLKCCSEAPFKDGSIRITVNTILVDGNRAAADGTMEAETLAGKPYHQSFCDLYEFEGERIKTMHSYLDTAYDKETLAGGATYQNK